MIKRVHNPDVLTCIANLSSDEVFTPPPVVNQMLDSLPKELWSNEKTTFLDPVSKSGVFLREITKRLIDGLEIKIPNLEDRVEHILHNQPHVDFPESELVEHFTCLYYINDSDGPTVVFNEKTKSEKYTIKYECHPEKNKLFVFDGKHYHASSCPKHHDARLAITINIIQRKLTANVKPFLRIA